MRRTTKPMLSISGLIGAHLPNDGEGITLQDLYELLRTIPRQARSNFVSVVFPDCSSEDVTGLSFGQSDQASKWDFNAHITTMEPGYYDRKRAEAHDRIAKQFAPVEEEKKNG